MDEELEVSEDSIEIDEDENKNTGLGGRGP